MLYAIGLGIAIGLALGGRLAALGTLQIRWARLAVAGLLVQFVLFAPAVTERVGDSGVLPYVGSSLVVLVVVLRNIALPGLPVVALGAAANLAAIIANGGWMPASPSALASLGTTIGEGYSNSRVVPFAALQPLTDTFSMPTWLPLANVFSVGDVLIAAGVVIAIVATLRQEHGAPPQLRRPVTAPGTDGSWSGDRFGP